MIHTNNLHFLYGYFYNHYNGICNLLTNYKNVFDNVTAELSLWITVSEDRCEYERKSTRHPQKKPQHSKY